MSNIQFSNEDMKKRIEKEVADSVAKKVGKIIAMVIGGFFLVFIFGFLFGFIIEWLWNVTMAEIFGLPTIGYWQAIGLFFLAKIIFGFGGSGPRHKHHSEKDKEKWKGWWDKKSKQYEDLKDGDDEMLQKYWQEQGKAAYESYLASHASEEQSASDNANDNKSAE